MSIAYSSRQDFDACMASIHGITLQRNLAFKYATQRVMYNQNQADFERSLHGAMGYKASTVDDWG